MDFLDILFLLIIFLVIPGAVFLESKDGCSVWVMLIIAIIIAGLIVS